MIVFSDEYVKLRQQKLINGVKPLYIEIFKGDHPFKGKYLLTIDKEIIRLYELKANYKFNMKAQNNYYIRLSQLEGYHYAYYKANYKTISLFFKDGLTLMFSFIFGYEETYGNEKNAEHLMEYLKEHKIYQKNEIRSDNNEQRQITKEDQFFTEAVRKTYKKRGLFGK